MKKKIMTDFIPFALPELGDEEISEVVSAIKSGWITTGPKVKAFEEDFSKFIGGDVESISVNSCTAGLHLALEAMGVQDGDEVILPTYTFTATAEVVRYLGATPIFADVEENSFNICPQSILDSITKKTKVIIPVHFAGLSCNMDVILKIAKVHNLRVLEDAAHALPTTWKGRKIGTLESDCVVFSFYANKTMTTGEGGMIVTRDPDIAKRCKVMRLHGISKDAFDRYVSTKPAWSYEVVAPGYKYNMTDMAAGMGIHQLKRLPEFQIKREKMAQRYNSELAGLPIVLPESAPDNELHARHLYPIRLNSKLKITRERFIERMSEEGIGCSVHFIPLHLQPYWRDKYHLTPDMYPVAQRLYEQEVSIPLYTKMTEDDQSKVIAAIKKVLII
jgi:dTDP-4-amino-4,6-dideoxygalactose transaminase